MTTTKTPALAAGLKILIVDDDRSVAYALDRALTESGHDVTYAFSAEQGLKGLKESAVDAVLLDLVMPGMNGMEMLRRLKAEFPSVDVVTMSGASGMRAAIDTLKLDAFDFLPKPIQVHALTDVMERLRQKRRKTRAPVKGKTLPALYSVPDLLGESEAMKRISLFIQKISPVSSSVLIRGETGTGKEIASHGVHNRSPRREGPFIAVNCSALPESMLESELFGHEKGAFTDATGLKRGLLEVADGGTLFLDEVGDMPLALQAKMLRVVETKRVRRLGSTVEQEIDVRFLAATHRDLEAMVRAGQFREDLFYRLSVFTLVLPPLRERREDIVILAEAFLKALARDAAPKILSPKALEYLLAYPWPGNVRELHNVMEQVVVFAEGDVIQPSDLPSHLLGGASPAGLETLEAVERRHIDRVLTAVSGEIAQAVRILGIDEQDLRARMARHGAAERHPLTA